MAKAELLNFRCPPELLSAIEEIGKASHPVDNEGRHHRSKRDYDLTATMLEIVQAGIDALTDDPTLLSKTDRKTIDKTEIEAMIQAAIAPIGEEVQEIKKL